MTPTTAPATQADQPVALQTIPRADLVQQPQIPSAIARQVAHEAEVRDLPTVQYGEMRANFHERADGPFPAALFSMWCDLDESHCIAAGGPYYIESSGAYCYIRPLDTLLRGEDVWVWGVTTQAATIELLLIRIQPTRDRIESEVIF